MQEWARIAKGNMHIHGTDYLVSTIRIGGFSGYETAVFDQTSVDPMFGIGELVYERHYDTEDAAIKGHGEIFGKLISDTLELYNREV